MVETRNDPYERLLETLNKIPHGFAKAKDGITHLKVLKWIFSGSSRIRNELSVQHH